MSGGGGGPCLAKQCYERLTQIIEYINFIGDDDDGSTCYVTSFLFPCTVRRTYVHRYVRTVWRFLPIN